MVEVINDSTPKARKEYYCDASIYIREHLSECPKGNKFKFSDWRKIANAKKDGWKIKIGEVYEKQVNKFEGDLCVFRSKQGLVDLCHKYELFPEL